jgi:hypothetical protein
VLVAEPNQNFFEFTDRWSDIGELPEESLPTEMITALDDRDKQLEHYLEIRSPGISGHAPQTVGVSGQWNDNGINASTRTTGTVNLSHAAVNYPTSFYPWVCPSDGTVTAVGWVCGTAGISTRIAMYNADGAGGLPLTLHRDLEYRGTTAATTYTYTLPVPMAVEGGKKYWWTFQTTANCSVSTLPADAAPVGTGFLTPATTGDCVLKSTDTVAGGVPHTLSGLVNISGSEVNMRFSYQLSPT